MDKILSKFYQNLLRTTVAKGIIKICFPHVKIFGLQLHGPCRTVV